MTPVFTLADADVYKLTIAEAYHVAPAAYYHFGGTLGVRFAERFGELRDPERAMRLQQNHQRLDALKHRIVMP